MKVPESARCFWTAPIRGNACPWLVETRVSVKEGTAEVHGWDCCAGHVRDANQLALAIIHNTGRGTWHTDRYERTARVKQRTNDVIPYRPYLVINDPELKDQMIIAQQSERPRRNMNDWITKIIRQYVEKGNDHVERDQAEGS